MNQPNPRALAVSKRSAMIRSISREQSTSIAMAGVDRERFGEAVVEAFRANPGLYSVDEVAFCNAIRKCCQDGLVPDGVEAALVPQKGGKCMYLPMKVGLQRMIHRDLKASIKSGVVYANDTVRLEKHSNAPDVFEVHSTPFADRGELVGAWCYVDIPGQHGDVVLMDRQEIEQVRSVSRTTYEDRPWNKWFPQMAEKTVIKRAMNRLRYLIPRNSRVEAALNDGFAEDAAINADTDEVPVTRVDVPEAVVVEEPEVVEVGPAQPEPAKAPAKAPVKEQVKEPVKEPAKAAGKTPAAVAPQQPPFEDAFKL